MAKWYGVWVDNYKTGYAGVIDAPFTPVSNWHGRTLLSWYDTEEEAHIYKQYVDSMITKEIEDKIDKVVKSRSYADSP